MKGIEMKVYGGTPNQDAELGNTQEKNEQRRKEVEKPKKQKVVKSQPQNKPVEPK